MPGVIDEVDDPELPDTKAPEVGASELHRPRGTWLDGKGEDRRPKSGCIAGRQAAKLALRGRRKVDPAAALAHSPSGA